jgi:mono/diheme cytochrome c family protein
MTLKPCFTALPAVLCLCAAGAASAQDAARGRELYDTHCVACHYERIHKRDPAKSLVRSLEDLRGQVAQRAAMTGRPFTREDLLDIVEYLNRSHYKLEK